LAELELAYNDMNRQLVSEANKSSPADTLVQLRYARFGLSPEEAHESAACRVRANRILHSTTSGRTTDAEGNGAGLEDDLCRCYLSIRPILQHRARRSAAQHQQYVQIVSRECRTVCT
jgi:hypothetical protein